jgi:hypothetical protein
MKVQRSVPARARLLVATTAAAGAVLGSGFFASAAIAAPDTFHTCTTGSSAGNVNTCMNVNGSDQFVQSAIASAHVVPTGSARTLEVCMYNPSETQIGCNPGGLVTVKAGGSISFTWAPDRNVNPGSYCADTGRQNSDGSVTIIGATCVTVNPNP